MIPFFDPLDSGIIEGGRRSGKSLLLTEFMQIAYNMGYEVITNMQTTIPHISFDSKDIHKFMEQLKAEIKRRDEKQDFHNTLLAIDEMHIIVPSQMWKKCADDGKVWAQVGKVGFTVWATAPQRSMIYNGYRDSCNKIITCKKLLRTDTEFKYKAIFQRQSDKTHDVYNSYMKCVFDANKSHFEKYKTHEVMYI